jgi:hypothetical protein
VTRAWTPMVGLVFARGSHGCRRRRRRLSINSRRNACGVGPGESSASRSAWWSGSSCCSGWGRASAAPSSIPRRGPSTSLAGRARSSDPTAGQGRRPQLVTRSLRPERQGVFVFLGNENGKSCPVHRSPRGSGEGHPFRCAVANNWRTSAFQPLGSSRILCTFVVREPGAANSTGSITSAPHFQRQRS